MNLRLPIALALILAFILMAGGISFADEKQQDDGTGKSVLIPKLEAKMGRSMTKDEKMRFRQAAVAWKDGMTAAVEKFARKLSEITGVPFEETNAMMPKFGQMTEPYKKDVLQKLEEKLGRKLTQDENKKIIAAAQEKKKDMEPVLEQFIKSLESITGLSKEQIREIIPKMNQ